MGYLSAYSANSGDYNIFIGYQAGRGTTATGNSNVGVGVNALQGGLTSGNHNTAIGPTTMNGVTSGANNSAIGQDSGCTGSPGGQVTTGSNGIFLGDENISEANIQVDWTIASDKRDKTDVSPMDLGLEFINQLEPVTYRWDKRSKYSDDQSAIPDGTHKEEQLEGGFLAQDVESLEEQYGHKLSDKTNLTFHLSEDEKMYGIKYGKFVPMLVKAVQELSAEVEELKEKLNGSN